MLFGAGRNGSKFSAASIQKYLDHVIVPIANFALAKKISNDNASRNTLTEGIYLPEDDTEALSAIDRCFESVLETKAIRSKIKNAIKKRTLHKGATLFKDALDANVITKEEYDLLSKTQAMSEAVVQVDTFKVKDYLARK